MEEVVIGFLLALAAGTVVPFVTAQAAAWLQQRRDHTRRTARLHERVVTMAAEKPGPADVPAVSDGVAPGWAAIDAPRVEWDADRQRIAAKLRAHFALFDKNVDAATRSWATRVSTAAIDEVMRLWANGNRITARIKARRLIARSTDPSR